MATVTRIRGVGVLSAAKMGAILYAGIGLVVGALVACVSLVGGFAALANQQGGAGAFGALFGVGAVVFFPILYGVFGCIGAMIVSLLYNLAARAVGGLEIELD